MEPTLTAALHPPCGQESHGTHGNLPTLASMYQCIRIKGTHQQGEHIIRSQETKPATRREVCATNDLTASTHHGERLLSCDLNEHWRK